MSHFSCLEGACDCSNIFGFVSVTPHPLSNSDGNVCAKPKGRQNILQLTKSVDTLEVFCMYGNAA